MFPCKLQKLGVYNKQYIVQQIHFAPFHLPENFHNFGASSYSNDILLVVFFIQKKELFMNIYSHQVKFPQILQRKLFIYYLLIQ